MRQLRLLGLVLLVTFAMSAIAAATAAAENPEILPTPTAAKPLTFTGTSGGGELETTKDSKISCMAGTGSGSFTSARSGTGKGDATGCKASGVGCNTAGDAKETVLSEGNFELVDILPGGVLTMGVKGELPTELEIICGSILKIKIKGSVIGEVSSLRKSLEDVKTATVVAAKSASLGEQAITTCDLPKVPCEGKTFKLETSFGGGFELSAAVVTGTLTFGALAEAHY